MRIYYFFFLFCIKIVIVVITIARIGKKIAKNFEASIY